MMAIQFHFAARRRMKRFAVLLIAVTSCLYLIILPFNVQNGRPDYQVAIDEKASEQKLDSFDFESEYAKLSCKFARLDPFDKSILDLISHPRTITCNQTQPYLSYLDETGRLLLNITELDAYPRSRCTYSTFDRHSNSTEDSVKGRGSSGQLIPDVPVTLDLDMVEVTCYDERNVEIYYDIHAHPVLDHSGKSYSKPTDDQLSVLMLMMDSTSISVLKRHLPKTYTYIKDVMKFHIFNGFHKVGDNSFPNMVAALTGYRYQYEQQDMPPDIDEDVSQITFDHWPLIWKNYADKGYATVFNEDKAEWGLFRYFVKGFERKPVDYYYHMYWYAVYERELLEKATVNGIKNDRYCFQNLPKIVRFLDIVKRHVTSMQNVLQFQYAFLTDLCHEMDGSEEERADEYMFEFFKNMHETGQFNKTVVLFYSDHGHRYTPIRNTLVGLLEERTPMYNVWFPDWFYKKNPQIYQNLRINTARLSSLYDVHETLHDICEANFNGTQRNKKSRGMSQLYPIPEDRSCFDAGVPDHHCTCVSMTPLPLDSPAANGTGHALLDHINDILSEYSAICAQFTLKRVIRAEQLSINKNLAYGITRFKGTPKPIGENVTKAPIELYPLLSFRVAIEVEPMDARFEAVVDYNSVNHTHTILGDVSRLNRFGKQSYCVPKKFLQKYCVCLQSPREGDAVQP